LTKASAKTYELYTEALTKSDEVETLFSCEASLVNETGTDLTTRSHFYSEFDGLELVVTTREGITLAQQPYLWHQSPYTRFPREFKLKKGATTKVIVFPVRELPHNTEVVKVRLVGHLPGCEYKRFLSSETLELKIKK
jgi:hypothetical protein